MPSSTLVSRSLVQQDKSKARLTTTIFVKTAFLAPSVIERTCSSMRQSSLKTSSYLVDQISDKNARRYKDHSQQQCRDYSNMIIHVDPESKQLHTRRRTCHHSPASLPVLRVKEPQQKPKPRLFPCSRPIVMLWGAMPDGRLVKVPHNRLRSAVNIGDQQIPERFH